VPSVFPRALALLLVLAGGAAAQCEAPPPPPPKPPPVAVPTPATKQLDKVDAEHRAKAAELGLARADTAEMEHVDSFLCGKLVGGLLTTKVVGERKALSADVDKFGCRDRKEWADVATKRAKELGMPDLDTASMRSVQTFVCRHLASAHSAAGQQDKASIERERDIFGCKSGA
jgi:hypothetical protein